MEGVLDDANSSSTTLAICLATYKEDNNCLIINMVGVSRYRLFTTGSSFQNRGSNNCAALPSILEGLRIGPCRTNTLSGIGRITPFVICVGKMVMVSNRFERMGNSLSKKVSPCPKGKELVMSNKLVFDLKVNTANKCTAKIVELTRCNVS